MVCKRNVADFEGSIQKAINSLPSAGGEVYIPAGTYSIAGSLLITKSNVSLNGAGPATIIQASGGHAAGAFVIASGVSNVHFKNFMLDQNSTVGLVGCIVYSGLHCAFENLSAVNISSAAFEFRYDCRQCSMINLSASGADGDPILIRSSNQCKIIGCSVMHVEGANQNGIGIYSSQADAGSCWGNTVVGCTVKDVKSTGINIEGATKNVILGNTIHSSSGAGISLYTVSGLTSYKYSNGNIIAKNIIFDAETYGIATDSGTQFCEICENYIDSPKNHGIQIYQSKNFVINNNYIINISGTNTAGIFTNNANECMINGNYIIGCSGHGIWAYAGSLHTINSNHCQDNLGYGIYSTGTSDYCIISNNMLVNNISGGISFVNANGTSGNNLVI